MNDSTSEHQVSSEPASDTSGGPSGRRRGDKPPQSPAGARRQPAGEPDALGPEQSAQPVDATGWADGAIRVSVIIPLYNEVESLEELTVRLTPPLEQISGGAFEVLFIDDGSTDASFDAIRRIHDRDPRYKAIRFRTNMGKSAALDIGFRESSGTVVFTMDADLQDEPAELPDMLNVLNSGFDLVSGWKKTRHDPWHKTVPSKFFNFVVQTVTGLRIHDFNCGLKVYRREVLPQLSVYGEMHRYLPAQAHWGGFLVTEMAVTHHPRKHGVSKFGMSRFVKGFLDLLTLVLTTRYARRPLHVFGTVGVLIAFIGFCIDAWLSIEWFAGKTSLTNRPLALLGVLLIIVGVQLVSIGLLGEMIVKNSLDRQIYPIRERLA